MDRSPQVALHDVVRQVKETSRQIAFRALYKQGADYLLLQRTPFHWQ
jgi:hypothetical protein